MQPRVEKTTTIVKIYLCAAPDAEDWLVEEEQTRGTVWIILKMEKMDAPSQRPRELPMSLITVMNVTLGMLRVTWKYFFHLGNTFFSPELWAGSWSRLYLVKAESNWTRVGAKLMFLGSCTAFLGKESTDCWERDLGRGKILISAFTWIFWQIYDVTQLIFKQYITLKSYLTKQCHVSNTLYLYKQQNLTRADKPISLLV